MEKTGVKVTAYTYIRSDSGDEEIKCMGEIDIADLKKGMLVKELPALREVAGEITEDEIDYLIPLKTDSGKIEYYSPLLVM